MYTDTMHARKQQLRQKMLRMRNSLSEQERKEMNEQLLRRLLLLPLYREAATILTYVSTKTEADTHSLIERAIADGKHVAVPKCGEGRSMEFYEIWSLDQLSPGVMGILEPRGDTDILTDSGALVIVPGLAFDHLGARVGYGGGYYDRYLYQHPDMSAVGFFYHTQEVEYIECAPHDQRLSCIVTDERLIVPVK